MVIIRAVIARVARPVPAIAVHCALQRGVGVDRQRVEIAIVEIDTFLFAEIRVDDRVVVRHCVGVEHIIG